MHSGADPRPARPLQARTCVPAGGTTQVPMAISGRKAVALTKPGVRHFMCSVGLHCVLGQAVTVMTVPCPANG